MLIDYMPTTTPRAPHSTLGSEDQRDLFQQFYGELRELAQGKLARERADHTLAPTALVHEVFVRLEHVACERLGRTEFLKLAATVMRHVLVDSARRRLARPTGTAVAGSEPHVDASATGARAGSVPAGSMPGRAGSNLAGRDLAMMQLDEALDALAERDPKLHRVVELRFLLGFDVERTACELGCSSATIKRAWRAARAFLQHRMQRNDD